MNVEQALRQSLELLALRVTTSRGGYPHPIVASDGGAVEELARSIEARLAATPEPAGLDVELLSRSLRAATLGTRVHVDVPEARMLAARIAHEYAVRLASSGEPKP